jgi:hypothetical protein
MKTNTNKILSKLDFLSNLKMVFVFAILFLLSYNITADTKLSSKVVSNYLNLSINVKTNVDCFTCDFHSEIDDTLGLVVNQMNSEYKIKGGQYIIPVMLINCHNKMMNNDLQSLFKVDEYPHIMIKLNNLIIDKLYSSKGKGMLSVNIDGKDQTYPVSFNNYMKDDALVINGNMLINLSDFSINPPSKCFGLIKVDKMITINFGIKLKVIPV